MTNITYLIDISEEKFNNDTDEYIDEFEIFDDNSDDSDYNSTSKKIDAEFLDIDIKKYNYQYFARDIRFLADIYQNMLDTKINYSTEFDLNKYKFIYNNLNLIDYSEFLHSKILKIFKKVHPLKYNQLINYLYNFTLKCIKNEQQILMKLN